MEEKNENQKDQHVVAFIVLVAVIVKHIPGAAANRKTPRMTLRRNRLDDAGRVQQLPRSVAPTMSEVSKALTQEDTQDIITKSSSQ